MSATVWRGAALAAVLLATGVRWLARRNVMTAHACEPANDVRDPAAVHDMTLHVLSHDLREPHASLLAWVALRRTQAQADAALLEQVADHARRALRHLDELNRLLRETGHAYRMRRIAMEALLDEALDRVWTVAAEAGVRLDRPAARLPRIGGDHAMLLETLEWLLSRAIGAAAQGTALRITCRGHAGGMALWIACDPAGAESAARLAEPGPALLCAQRVVARHGGVLVPLQPMGEEKSAEPEDHPAAGWYLWLRRRPRP
ncbi:sensor histidine kinase [Cupriavidus necator]|uniref:sensor histidine kinase n=1 Tax=Cupriavidus necator TaxID=106590 RepID=UPI00339D8971